MTSTRSFSQGSLRLLRNCVAWIVWGLLVMQGRAGAEVREAFVVVGSAGRVALSHNGLTWSEESHLECDFVGVGRGLGRFVAVGGKEEVGCVLSSTDGRSWVTSQKVKGTVSTIAFGKGRFVACGGGALLWSKDGEEFREGERLPVNGLVRARRSACGDTEAGFSFAVIGDMERPGHEQSVHWRGVTLDGQRWTFHAVDTAAAHDIAYGSGHFVVVGPRGLIESSHDGQHWKRHHTGVDDDFSSVVWTGKRFLVSGRKQVWSSPDALNWKAEPLEIPCAIQWAREGPQTRAIGLSVGGELWISNDLREWQKVALKPGFRSVAVGEVKD